MKHGTMWGAVLALGLVLPVALGAQEGASTGTILIAHGAGPEWNAQVEEIARLAETGGPLEVSYLMGPGAAANPFHLAAQRLAERGVREIVVVPLLVSSYSGHFDQLRYLVGETDELDEVMMHHLGMAGIQRPEVSVPIRLAAGFDDSPAVAQVLAERALDLAEAPEEQALFLLAHGPNSAENNAEWMKNLRSLAERVQSTAGFRYVHTGTVRDDAPALVRAEAVRGIREMIALQHDATGRPVVVVPVLISTGEVSREKFPRDLAGLPIVYSGEALLPHPGLAKWLEERAREGGRMAAQPSVPAAAGAHHHPE